MASSPRSGDAPRQLEVGRRPWRPDRSGTRARPDDADDTIEELDASDLELVETPRPTRPRSTPPAPPLASLTRRDDRVDLDALVFEVGCASTPMIASAPVVVRPEQRPTWRAALLMAGGAMLVGAAAVLVIVTAREAAVVTRRDGIAVAKLDAAKPAPQVAVAGPERTVSGVEASSAPRAAEAWAATEAPASAEPRPLGRAEPIEHAVRSAPRTARLERRAARQASAASAAEPRPVTTAEHSALPEQPARTDVERAIAGVLPAMRECASGLGVVELELHFAPSGRTTIARAASPRATPAQRSCMARAARGARVPPFSGAHLTVRYPAQL